MNPDRDPPLTEREVELELVRMRQHRQEAALAAAKARNKLATKIAVMTSNEERSRMPPGVNAIAWARTEASSADPVQRARWSEFLERNPPPTNQGSVNR